MSVSGEFVAAASERYVLVVEDEKLTRSLIVEMLESAGFQVRGCASAAEALRECRYFDPDAVVTDIDLGAGPSGLDLVETLARTAPHVSVLVLSNYPILRQHPVHKERKLAYLDKRHVDGSRELITALEAVLRDDRAMIQDSGEADAALARLSAPQLETLRLMAEGYSNAEIAARRGISKRANESLIRRMIATLGIKPDERMNPRVQAVRLYFRSTGLPR
jgi:DNA-binding NarL/FixJ family response regulator